MTISCNFTDVFLKVFVACQVKRVYAEATLEDSPLTLHPTNVYHSYMVGVVETRTISKLKRSAWQRVDKTIQKTQNTSPRTYAMLSEK